MYYSDGYSLCHKFIAAQTFFPSGVFLAALNSSWQTPPPPLFSFCPSKGLPFVNSKIATYDLDAQEKSTYNTRRDTFS